MYHKILCICCLFFLCSLVSFSQNDVLSTKISYTATNKPLTEVLRDIEKTTNIRFTFNSSIIPDTELVSINIQQQTLNDALKLILGNKYNYKLFGNQILITINPTANQTPQPIPEQKPIKPQIPKQPQKTIVDTIRVYDTIRTRVTDTVTVKVYDTILYTQPKYKKAYEKPVSTLTYGLYTGSLLSIPITTGALNKNYKQILQKADNFGIGNSKTLTAQYSKQDVTYRGGLQYVNLIFSNTFSSTTYINDGIATYTDTLWYWKYTKLFTYYKFNSTGDSVAITVYDSLYTYTLKENPKKIERTDNVTSRISLQYISIPLELGYSFLLYNNLHVEPALLFSPQFLIIRKGLYPGAYSNTINIQEMPIKRVSYSLGVSCNIGMQVYKEFGIMIKPILIIQPKVFKNQNIFQQVIPTFGLEWGISYTIPYEIF